MWLSTKLVASSHHVHPSTFIWGKTKCDAQKRQDSNAGIHGYRTLHRDMLEGFGGNRDGRHTVMPPQLMKERLQNKKACQESNKTNGRTVQWMDDATKHHENISSQLT